MILEVETASLRDLAGTAQPRPRGALDSARGDQVTEWTQVLRSEISELSPRLWTLPAVPDPEAPDVPVIPN